jgi:hypothetical protein
MNRANQLIGQFGELVKRQYGFVADHTRPLWENIEKRIGEMEVDEWNARPRNMACHNLLRENPMPVGITSLLGLGLNYCVKPTSTNNTTEETYNRMKGTVRRLYAMKDEENNDNYIKKLYLKSDYEFGEAPQEIERAMNAFQQAMEAKKRDLQRRRRKRPRRNINHTSWELIQLLRDNDTYIVVHGDKNLGPCIIDRKYYIYRGCMEHLGNERNYKPLTEEGARNRQRGLQIRFRNFLTRYGPRGKNDEPVDYVCISDAEDTFLRRAIKQHAEQLAKFRMTAKVHKTPWKLRPIVCCAGTFMNDWSRWLDFWLQKLKPVIPTYLKDGQQVLDETKQLQLPPNAWLFTADADSMYNNIDTEHAILVITWWLKDLDSKNLLPENFPLEAVIEAMTIIMRNNIFEWGDMFFLQLLGTAMGTSSAVMWATLYYAYHEVHTLIPKHGHNLLYFKRFIDDIFGVWIGNTTTEWDDFCNDVDTFGILTWDIKKQKLSSSVDFLDLTLTIEGSRIVSRTFQKTMNLYLYLPSASAHSLSCIKGTIYGLINRYYAQNTYRKDYVYFVVLLYVRLLQRGWNREFISGLISEASSKIEANSTAKSAPTKTSDDTGDLIFIHMVYHPDDISRAQVRQVYEETLGPLLEEVLGIKRAIVAYSRPKNIGDYVTKAKLHQAPGVTASIIMGEYKQGLDP